MTIRNIFVLNLTGSVNCRCAIGQATFRNKMETHDGVDYSMPRLHHKPGINTDVVPERDRIFERKTAHREKRLVSVQERHYPIFPDFSREQQRGERERGVILLILGN